MLDDPGGSRPRARKKTQPKLKAGKLLTIEIESSIQQVETPVQLIDSLCRTAYQLYAEFNDLTELEAFVSNEYAKLRTESTADTKSSQANCKITHTDQTTEEIILSKQNELSLVRVDLPLAEVNITIVSDAEIAVYNERWLQHSGATDVLAFDDHELNPETKRLHLGDIMISYDTACREAEDRQVSPNLELALYALHGFLHLLGMRDHDPASRNLMAEAALIIFKQIGQPCPPL